MSKPIESNRITLQAIKQVRSELKQCSVMGNDIDAHECLSRLINLYASIDADILLDCIDKLENNDLKGVV